MLEIEVLGPVRAIVDGTEVPIGSGRQRCVLAALAVAPGQVASVDTLIDAVWGEEPPPGARSTLQSYVSRLRSALGDTALAHAHGGYRLSASTDLAAVEELVTEARALAGSDPGGAAERLRQAVGRWRGSALLDVAVHDWFLPQVVRLEELRATLTEDLAAALLDAGRLSEALPELERAAVEHPHRERTHLLLVRCLAQAGRAADALRAADRFRRRLADGTGLDPSPALAALEQRVLTGELAGQALERAEQPAGSTPRRRAASLARPGALIGRDDELAELAELVAVERLVTVVGPGGVGKTRLVAEVAGRLREREVVAVELAGASAPDLGPVLAEGLGLTGVTGDHAAAVAEHLSVEQLLLVLDNCEHVLAAVAAMVRQVLEQSPGTSVLATSRTRLGIPQERVLPLGPLRTDGSHPPALSLLLDRLRRAAPDRELASHDVLVAAELCRELDGVPLALELAASRAATLGVTELRTRIDQSLDLLEAPTSAAPRHATLRAVVGWSYGLLGAADQAAFDALAVFEGDVELSAAEAVIAPVGVGSATGAVARLAEASLVQVLPSGRFRMLDTVRRFGRERLAARPVARAVSDAHDEWVVAETERVASRSVGPDEATVRGRIHGILGELRATLRRLEERAGDELAARCAAALCTVVIYRPDGELLGWLRRLASHADPAPAVLAGAARAAYLQGDLVAARTLAEGVDTPAARHALGVTSLYHGDHDAALSHFDSVVSAARSPLGDRLDALGGVALAHTYAGRFGDAEAALTAHRLLADAAGSPTYRAFGDYVAGEIALGRGDDDEAIANLERALQAARLVHADFVVGVASTALVSAMVRSGDGPRALATAADLVDHWWRSGTWPQLWTTLRLVAEPLVDAGHGEAAALVLAAAAGDPAAPAVTGADTARLAALQVRAAQGLPAQRRAAVDMAAGVLPRAAVVQQVRELLRPSA